MAPIAEIPYIDYWQDTNYALTTRFGLRVWQDHFSVIIRLSDERPLVYGESYVIPLRLEDLPSLVRMIIDNYMLENQASDLMDILSGKKPLHFRPARN